MSLSLFPPTVSSRLFDSDTRKSRLGNFVARMSQIAFFTRDGDMRGRWSRISRPRKRGRSSGLRVLCPAPYGGATHNPNTYSTMAWRRSRTSGELSSLVLAPPLGPDAMAIYCRLLYSKVIGGAEKPEPTLIFHFP